jgi:site-specific DNA recombinase
MKTAAIYARVSSDKQREENTIASQTAALVAFAREQQFEVPQEWVFEDDGYSGASLIRPGLERVRDLAAEGLIQAILVYAPDRLSRRYAYQVLLIEEFARAGVETLFVHTPRGSTPEDELLVQFQGMIAEYERAQILERSRRGKRHRARQGEVSVLSGAPFGYRFICKTDQAAAYYQVNEEQARIVRRIFELYSVEGLSIGAIARVLNEQAVPTCKRRSRWERSTVWGMLRNPAYKGQACFGKTTLAPRQRITRPIRLRGGIASRNSASHERPRSDWIAIAVPQIVSEETFALAQERLEANKTHAPRRTVTPSVVQGLVSCAKCGYALYRTSTRSSARTIYYYRCLGSDGWRRLSGPVCNNRPVRQDLLDEVVWTEIVRLLEDPQLIQNELDRRLKAAREADPSKRREEALRRDLARIRKSIDRLLTAYQEGLLSLDELRERMPNLRRREQADNSELQAIVDQSVERAACLRLAETLTKFLARLRSSAKALDTSERQRVLRLLVKEILVGDDKIIIRHSIPLPTGDGSSAQNPNGAAPGSEGYVLRSRSHDRTLPRPTLTDGHDPVFHDARREPFADQADDAPVADPMLHEPYEPFLVHRVEERLDVGVQYEAHLLAVDPDAERIQRIVRAASWSESVRDAEEVFLVDRVQQRDHRPLDDLVLKGCDRERALPAVRLGYVHAPGRQCPIRSPPDPVVQVLELALKVCLVVLPCQPIHARRGILLEFVERLFEQVDADVVEERGEPLLLPFPCDFPYAVQRL